MKIILASKSERRKELLKKICKEFEVVDSNFDEDKIKEKDPIKYVITCAVEKAKIVGEKYPDSIVIGADTIVFLNDEIIGKPSNYKEAKEILKKLSGTEHSVITGIAIYKKDQDKLITDYEISYVKFRNIEDEEIDQYLKTGDFIDKAGAYGIQNIGDRFVEYIKGDFENVVGLPVEKLKKYLEEFIYEELTVDVYDIALPNNWGVGRYENLVIFVPGGITGDKLRIRISKLKKNYSFGEIVKIEKPSEFRIKPECEHFGNCGGCSLQNILYDKQLEIKKNYLISTLKKIGEIEYINLKEFIPSPEIYFYRNKMEFAFSSENNKLVLGLRERNLPYKKYTKKVIPLKKCPIFSSKVEKIFQPVCDFFSELNLPPYDPFKKKGILRHLVIKESKNKDEIMLVFVTKSGVDINSEKLIELLLKEIKGIKSIYWVENDQISDAVSYEKKYLIYGKEFIEERINDLTFRIYPETFFQPNTKATEILYEKIKENVKENSRVLSLYCGAGPIEIFISDKVKEVIGVDWEKSNIKAANENCFINNIENCKFYAEKVENFLNRNIGSFDCLIVDPPRGGLSKKVIKKILMKKIPEIIYVSCNPSTLARDIKEIINNGYVFKYLYFIDCFPHTSHIESIAILEKSHV
ncbi:MAG: 23S rRNA (uracil(1939)-C(5))-methyltransferase RlmD [Candidatus Ratteibacteria bacterium]